MVHRYGPWRIGTLLFFSPLQQSSEPISPTPRCLFYLHVQGASPPLLGQLDLAGGGGQTFEQHHPPVPTSSPENELLNKYQQIQRFYMRPWWIFKRFPQTFVL